MATSAVKEVKCKPNVGMGQIIIGSAPAQLGAVLGSCVGVCLAAPELQFCALAHVVLPEAGGRTGPPGKFADTAIPQMLSLLEQQGVRSRDIVAKIAGGANMFGAKAGPMQIGDKNIAAVEAALSELNIPIRGRHLGGSAGRRVTVSCESGEMKIEIVGAKPVVL